MNVWTAVLQKINIFRSFVAHSKARTMYFTSDLLFKHHNIYTQIQSRVVCAHIWRTILISTNTHHFTLLFLFVEGGQHISHHWLTLRAHILHHWHHHIICRGKGSIVEGCDECKKVSNIFGGVGVVIKQFNLSKFNWKIFDVVCCHQMRMKLCTLNQISNMQLNCECVCVFGGKMFEEENVRENTCVQRCTILSDGYLVFFLNANEFMQWRFLRSW